MKTNSILVALAFSLGSVLMSCKEAEVNSDVKLETNLLKSPEKYLASVGKRSEQPGSFTIENIQRNADTLNISVRGGCNEEDFMVVWDGQIALSHPAQVYLVLNRNSKEDCGTDGRFDVKVNLRKIIDKQNPEDFIFHVANGSVKQDKSLNPNGSVTQR